VYYQQEAEGTMKVIQAIRACPDLGSFYPQSNIFAPDAESRLRCALVSSDADPTDDYAFSYNIATQGSVFYSPPADPTIPVALPSNLFPSACRRPRSSQSGSRYPRIGVQFSPGREETHEAALLQFAACCATCGSAKVLR
jgi:hypothetical protein